MRGAEAGDGSDLWLDERTIFLGADRSRGSSLICPALEAYVASRLHDESSVLKERRKGREERLLARSEALDGGTGASAAALGPPPLPPPAKGGGRGRRGRQ